MSKTLSECISEWQEKTDSSIQELKEITETLNRNEEKLYSNYNSVF